MNPDKNIHNLFQEDCRYYLPSELQNAIDKADIISNQNLSVIHINARNMLVKLGQINTGWFWYTCSVWVLGIC